MMEGMDKRMGFILLLLLRLVINPPYLTFSTKKHHVTSKFPKCRREFMSIKAHV